MPKTAAAAVPRRTTATSSLKPPRAQYAVIACRLIGGAADTPPFASWAFSRKMLFSDPGSCEEEEEEVVSA